MFNIAQQNSGKLVLIRAWNVIIRGCNKVEERIQRSAERQTRIIVPFVLGGGVKMILYMHSCSFFCFPDYKAAGAAFTGLSGSHLWSVGRTPQHQGKVCVHRDGDGGMGGGVLGGICAMSLLASQAAEPLNIHPHRCGSSYTWLD